MSRAISLPSPSLLFYDHSCCLLSIVDVGEELCRRESPPFWNGGIYPGNAAENEIPLSCAHSVILVMQRGAASQEAPNDDTTTHCGKRNGGHRMTP